MVEVTVKVRDLQGGDVFPGEGGWTAQQAAQTVGGVTRVAVQYTGDGGMGYREWDDPDIELTVERMT